MLQAIVIANWRSTHRCKTWMQMQMQSIKAHVHANYDCENIQYFEVCVWMLLELMDGKTSSDTHSIYDCGSKSKYTNEGKWRCKNIYMWLQTIDVDLNSTCCMEKQKFKCKSNAFLQVLMHSKLWVHIKL